MEIIIAEHAGFCFGVKRAVDMAEEELKKNHGRTVYCLGSLIHNPQVIERLEKQGFRVVKDPDQVPEGAIFLVRSHGISRELVEKMRLKNCSLIDATCPFVGRAQKIAEDLHHSGYQVAISGDPDHAEVIGINSHTKNTALIFPSPESVTALGRYEKIGLLAQTTQKEKVLWETAEKLKPFCQELKVENTICLATSVKQNEVKDLAQRVNLMIVVGGKESSNTTKLADLARAAGTATFHIETAQELEKSWFSKAEKVGIAAGASTPQFLIEEVAATIRKLTT